MASLRDWLTERGLAAMLWWKSRPGSVEGALARHTFRRAASPSRNRVTVGLAQMRMELAASAADYALRVYRLTRAAVERGAQLVAFPEYTGALLLGLLPGVRELASGRSMQDALSELAGDTQVSVGGVFRAVAPAARKIYNETFSTLAQVWDLPDGRFDHFAGERRPALQPRAPVRAGWAPRRRAAQAALVLVRRRLAYSWR
jgi:hypothetical protein